MTEAPATHTVYAAKSVTCSPSDDDATLQASLKRAVGIIERRAIAQFGVEPLAMGELVYSRDGNEAKMYRELVFPAGFENEEARP